MLDAILGAASDQLIALCDMDAPLDAEAISTALRLIQEWRLSDWAHAANLEGVAPPTSSMLDQWERLRAILPEGLRPPPWGTSASSQARTRVSRFRSRWGGRVGCIRVQDAPPPEVMRQKAYGRFVGCGSVLN